MTTYFRTVLTVLLVSAACTSYCAEDNEPPKTSTPSIKAEWKGDLKVVSYHGREYIVGTRNDAAKEYPLVGRRTLHATVYSADTYPMTLQSQETFVIVDTSRKATLVYNIVTCLKGKDAENSEKTDWVGEIESAGEHYRGDIMLFRKYDKKGPAMKAPYYSMGRDFPIGLNGEGGVTVQYNYLGDVNLDLAAREVSDEMVQRIVDDHDKHYKKQESKD